jgi:hypothetical protein
MQDELRRERAVELALKDRRDDLRDGTAETVLPQV